MMIVADASVVIDGLVNISSRGEECRTILTSSEVFVPGLIFSEVSSVLRRYELSGTPDVDGLFAQLIRMPWDTIDFVHYAELVWPLRHDISLYDACYVALAMVLRAPLVTLDRKLASSATRYCEVIIPGE
jgi:predicted nucleic acid-binding protein